MRSIIDSQGFLTPTQESKNQKTRCPNTSILTILSLVLRAAPEEDVYCEDFNFISLTCVEETKECETGNEKSTVRVVRMNCSSGEGSLEQPGRTACSLAASTSGQRNFRLRLTWARSGGRLVWFGACSLTQAVQRMHQPGIEPGSHRWQRCILPLDH